MYSKLSIVFTSALAIVATALPHSTNSNDFTSVTHEARGRTNFRVCGSRSSPTALFSLSDQNPTRGGSRSGNRILLKSQGNRATDGVTLALFEPLAGHTRCQLNFVLPQSNSASQGQVQGNPNNNFRFSGSVRVDVFQVPRPAAAGQQNFSPSWSGLGAQGLPVWGTFNLAAPGTQVVNVADCSKSSAFLMRISQDSQAKDFVFDQQNQVGEDQNTSLGLFMSYDC